MFALAVQDLAVKVALQLLHHEVHTARNSMLDEAATTGFWFAKQSCMGMLPDCRLQAGSTTHKYETRRPT